jgi:hypothetical protein
MIETKDITKMVQHVVRRNRGIADPQIMHPMREWVTGIGVTALGVFAGSILAAWSYTYYQAKTDEVIVVTETPIPYNASLVAEALSIYRSKLEAYNAVTNTSRVSDVSDSNVVEIGEIATTTEAGTDAEPVLDTSVINEDEAVIESSLETPVAPDLAI